MGATHREGGGREQVEFPPTKRWEGGGWKKKNSHAEFWGFNGPVSFSFCFPKGDTDSFTLSQWGGGGGGGRKNLWTCYFHILERPPPPTPDPFPTLNDQSLSAQRPVTWVGWMIVVVIPKSPWHQIHAWTQLSTWPLTTYSTENRFHVG